MHKEVLTKKELKLLPFIEKFSKNFGLVGGTAIALQIGHRESVDFDLFSNKEFKNSEIRKKVKENNYKIEKIFQDKKDEYSILIKEVKVTFLYYPFKINFSENFNNIKMPDLSTLGAMKAYTLGRRAKWKDYVDLYFIAKEKGNLKGVIKKAKEIFKEEFNEKNFRVQLSYFKDIDYSEEIIYKEGVEVDKSTIKEKLKEISLK